MSPIPHPISSPPTAAAKPRRVRTVAPIQLPRWFVVHCRSAYERVADENLRRQGYETYLPMQATVRAHSTEQPLFPSYLFTRFDPTVKSMAPISATRGVIRLVRFGTQCAVLPDEAVAALRRREDATGLHPNTLDLFAVADRVAVTHGPFRGQIAAVRERDVGAEMIVVSLDWVARMSIRRQDLELVR